ncbi:MAG: zinc ribbon domain-containing protein [Spirochaetota bacterium]
MIDFSIYAPPKKDVYAYKCPECGTLYYPAPMICRKCSNRRDPSGVFFSPWDRVPLGGRCKLLTWSRVYNLPTGYNQQYIDFCMVEFKNGLRACGHLNVQNPKKGMELQSKVGIVREKVGMDVYGFIFEKAE